MSIEFSPDKKFNDDQEFEINDEEMKLFKAELIKVVIEEIKNQVIRSVIPSIGPQNFEGEAITYMKQNGIPLTENGLPEIPGVRDTVLGIKQYSRLMLKEFVDNVDDMIIYNEEENDIVLSPFIIALEYGDFYRPILKTITRSIEQVFTELS